MEFAKTFKTELINVGIFVLLSNATVTTYIEKALKLVMPTNQAAGDYILYTKAGILLVASLVLNRVLSS